MLEKYINLLENQVSKLDSEDFDLEAWKSSTSSILSRIFGSADPRVKQIEDLKIDYGSWALRDAKASYNPLQTNKKKGKEILETSIYELENFGLPKVESSIDGQILLKALEDELKVSQYRELTKILEKEDQEGKHEILIKKISSFSKESLANILAAILNEKEFKDLLKT